MTRKLSLAGVGTALVTPFTSDGVDRKALEALVRSQMAVGVDFLVPCGTTGESPTLTDKERAEVIEAVVQVVDGRVPVVAGTGTNDTPHSVAMTKAAKSAGADACLAVAPYYNRPTQEGIYRHVRAMVDDGGLPAVLYHIPGRCGVGIDVPTIARLVEAGGIVGLKETETVSRVTAIREACDVRILSGDDGLTLPMMALGAVGVVSVASNVVLGELRRMVQAMARQDVERAREVHTRLSPIFRALFLEPNPIPVKAALQMTDAIPSDMVRLPLVAASPATRRAIREALGALGASS